MWYVYTVYDTCLTIREDAHIVAVQYRDTQRLHRFKDLFLSAHLTKYSIVLVFSLALRVSLHYQLLVIGNLSDVDILTGAPLYLQHRSHSTDDTNVALYLEQLVMDLLPKLSFLTRRAIKELDQMKMTHGVNA